MWILIVGGRVHELHTPILPGGELDVREMADDSPVQVGWLANEGGTFSPPAPPAPASWEVPKLLLVDRLIAAGRLRQAYAALRLDDPATALSDGELALRERWKAAVTLRSDDADVRSLLTAVGADPDAILAR